MIANLPPLLQDTCRTDRLVRLRVDAAGPGWPLWAGVGRGPSVQRLPGPIHLSTHRLPVLPRFLVVAVVLPFAPAIQPMLQHSPCPHDRPPTLFCPSGPSSPTPSSTKLFSAVLPLNFSLAFLFWAGLACSLCWTQPVPAARTPSLSRSLFFVLSRCVFHPLHAERYPHPTKSKRPKPLSILKSPPLLPNCLFAPLFLGCSFPH